MSKATVLFFAADPLSTHPTRPSPRLQLDEDVRRTREKVRAAEHRDALVFDLRLSARPDDLIQALNETSPQVVHFSGHGFSKGLVLVGSDGGPHLVGPDALGRLFTVFRGDIRVVVLNACLTLPQAQAIAGAVGCAIGTREKISDEAAITFGASFYRALAFGHSVQTAFEQACVALALEHPGEEETPQLIAGPGVDPAQLFVVRGEDREGVTDAGGLRAAVERLVAGSDTSQDRSRVQQALLAGRIVYTAGERPAGAGGGTTGTLIVTGGQDRLELAVPDYERLRERLFPPPQGIAPPFPELLFIGREQALNDVKGLLGVGGAPGAPSRTAIVRGWPGVGKTTLVSVLSRDPEVAKRYTDGVLWTSLDQNPSLMTILAGWGRALGRDDLLRLASPEEAVQQLTALLRDRKMLLIADDVWEAAHGALFQQARSGGCGLLITTRLPEVADALAQTENAIYPLPVLAEDDALKLMRILAPAVVEQHPDECRELVTDLECLPLALHVAARLLRAEARLGLGVSELLKDIREGAALIEARAPADRVERGTIPTVAALLQKSTDVLDEHTRDCFAYLGAFAPKPATFDLEAMRSVWEVDDPRPVVRELVEHGLLEPAGAGRFQMHALLVKHALSFLT
ncbi:MAG TPA: NB-ARC domain-containing protein [Longimicrobium sp.]|nr:NB-ARC domain-containing protein [Longimicrobium sp.]